MSDKQPDNIRIGVKTAYIEEQSDPGADRYVFAYTITIRNDGKMPAKLLNRHWIITDANGRVQEVRGEGVVGQQPYLAPGEDFEYTSGTVLETPVGAMEGEYEMRDDSGRLYWAPIAAFSLSVPRMLH